MTADHPVRRLLARLCSPDTMTRVVDPTLADMRVEGTSWRGYAGLARALTLHLIVSAPEWTVRMWTDDERALPRAVTACAAAALLLAAPLMAVPAQSAARLSWRAILFLVPQALAVALPASLMIAIPLAFRHGTSRRRLVARGLVLSLFCAAATTAVIVRLLPDANQGFRVEAAMLVGQEHVHLDRGPIEMTQHDLRDRIETLKLTPGGVPVARKLEYVYQLKYALGAIALPLGALAIGLAMSSRGRRHPILLGGTCAIAYVLVIFPLESAAGLMMLRFVALPPALFAWMPTLAVAAIAATGAATLLRVHVRRAHHSCA